MTMLKGARPSPALVVAVMALVAALAGSAVAEVATTSKLAKKDRKQVRKIAKKVSNNQINKQFPVQENQVADGAISNNKLANPIYSAVVDAQGNLVRNRGATDSTRLAQGLYEVGFERDLSQCTWLSQVSSPNAVPVASGEVSASLRNANQTDKLLLIVNNSAGVVADRPFHVLVYC